MSDIIKAPFTEEQVKNLNAYQKRGQFHPFTCCSQGPADKCTRRMMEFDGSDESDGLLKATTDGWSCPCGHVKQDWAHAFMASKDWSKEPSLFEQMLNQKNDEDKKISFQVPKERGQSTSQENSQEGS